MSAVDDNRPAFCPSRLTLARRRRGVTKIELSAELGVYVRAVSAYELGEYAPSEAVISRMSAFLGFPEVFFFGDPLEEPTPDTVSFRAQSKMTASQRDMALSQGALALHLTKWLDKHFELPSQSIPSFDRSHRPEAAAEALRRDWGLGNSSIRNMVHLLESKGVRLFSLSVKAKEVDAFSMWRSEIPFIFLNLQKSAERSRFDAAHELGHLVLHRHAAPQGREAEKEADAFASAFLMPRSSVLANIPRLATVSTLIQLKKIWGVSVAAIAHRLHSLNAISDWHYRSIYIQLAQMGFSKSEPEPCAHEISQLLTKAFEALKQEGIGRRQVAQELGFTVSELDDLLLGLAFGRIDGGKSAGLSVSSAAAKLTRVK